MRNEMPVSKKILCEVFGRENICLLSAKYCNKKRPVTKLLTEASIPPIDDFKTSLTLRLNFVTEAIKDSLELLDLLNNLDKEKLAVINDMKSFDHEILCGLISVETRLEIGSDSLKINCISKQDGVIVGIRKMEFSIFEGGLPLKDFL